MIQTLTNQEFRETTDRSGDRAAIEQLARSARRCFARVIEAAKPTLPAVAIAGAFVLTIGSVLTHHAGSPGAANPMTVGTTCIVVGRGASLWQIAHQYGDPHVAMQDRIESLARLNGIQSGSTLIAGQRLLVPVSNPVALESHPGALASR